MLPSCATLHPSDFFKMVDWFRNGGCPLLERHNYKGLLQTTMRVCGTQVVCFIYSCNHGIESMVFSSLFWLRISGAPLGVRLPHLLSMSLAKVYQRQPVLARKTAITRARRRNGGGETS